MTRTEFRKCFERALNIAAQDVEAKLEEPISHSFLIKLHSFGCDDRLMSIDEAIDKIYLGSDSFYRIIDVAIEEVLQKESVAFVRVSGHLPDAIGKTWDPTGLGPFKPMVFDKIEDRRVQGN
jgi:hypothetical protein